MKLDLKNSLPSNEIAKFRELHYGVMAKNPSAMMLVKRGMGLGFDAVVISLHQDYSSCDKFRTFIRQKMTDKITDMDTFLINLEEEENNLPISFNLLALQMLSLPRKNKLGSRIISKHFFF